MPVVERVIEYYFGVVVVVGGLSVLLGVKCTLRTWRRFPEVRWLGRAFGMGLLALILASILELPVLLLGSGLALAAAAGLVEESVKLLPLAFFRDAQKWEKWKLVAGTGFFLGLIEGLAYTMGIIALGESLYLAGVRVVLVGLHTVWAVVSAGFLLSGRRWKRFRGLAFSMAAHAVYDLPPLAAIEGLPVEVVTSLAAISTAFMLVTAAMVEKAAKLATGLIPEEEEKEELTSLP